MVVTPCFLTCGREIFEEVTYVYSRFKETGRTLREELDRD